MADQLLATMPTTKTSPAATSPRRGAAGALLGPMPRYLLRRLGQSLLTLFLTGTTLNVMSLMGVVMMVGIVVSNSILIVEFTNRLRAQGHALREAVSLACRVRLRPVLMTSLATLIGLTPLALKLGTGAEAYAPLARAIIGGLAVSVVLTVFIVPAAYYLAHRGAEQRHTA